MDKTYLRVMFRICMHTCIILFNCKDLKLFILIRFLNNSNYNTIGVLSKYHKINYDRLSDLTLK